MTRINEETMESDAQSTAESVETELGSDELADDSQSHISEQETSAIVDLERQEYCESRKNSPDRHSQMSSSAINSLDEKADEQRTRKPGIPVPTRRLSDVNSRSFEKDIQSPPPSGAGHRSRSHEPTHLRKDQSKSGIPRMSHRERDHSVKTESEKSLSIKESSRCTPKTRPRSNTKHTVTGIKAPKPVNTIYQKPSGIPTKHVDSPSASKNSLISNTTSKVTKPKMTDVNKRMIETKYNSKKKALQQIKKDLDDKQKLAIDIFKDMVDIRQKLKDHHGKEIPLEELRIVEYGSMMEKIGLSGGDEKSKVQIDPKKVNEFTVAVQNIPNHLMETVRALAKKKIALLDNIFNEKGEWSQDSLIKKISIYKEQLRKCELMIERKLSEEEKTINSTVTEWHTLMLTAGCEDNCIRDDLASKLQENEHKLKQTVAELNFEKNRKIKDIERFKELDKEVAKLKDKLQESTKSLSDEKNKSQLQKERVTSLESKLKSAKGKLRDGDSVKHDYEAKIDILKAANKKAEEQWKSKEVYYENRHKELLKASKASEAHVQKLEKERHSVNSRADDAAEKLVETDQKLKTIIAEKEAELEVQRETMEQLNLENEQLASRIENLKLQLIEKESLSANVYDILDRMKDFEGQEPETKLEKELWTELKRTQSQLVRANEILESYASEKTRFIETMRRNEGEGDNLRQLMEKENEISNLKIINKQLQVANDGNLRMMDEFKIKVIALEKQVAEYKLRLFEEQKDTEELVKNNITMYQQKLQTTIGNFQSCDAEVISLKRKLNVLELSLQDHQMKLSERDEMLVIAQENKNEITTENENLKRYVKHLRSQLTELSQEHSMKMVELQSTYCLLEEKTHYVTNLENTLKAIELKNAAKPMKNQKSKKTIQDRPNFMAENDYTTLNMSLDKRNKLVLKSEREGESESSTGYSLMG